MIQFGRRRLGDIQACLVRVAVQESIRKLEQLPAMRRKVELLKDALEMFYSAEIEVSNDHICERCNEKPCVCGDLDFEAHNIQQLDAAEDREVL